MLRPRPNSIWLSIVLLALSARAFSALTCPGEPVLGLVLAAMGVSLLACRGEIRLSPASVVCIGRGRWTSALVAGLVLACAFISTPVLKLFAWRLHEIPLAGALYHIVVRLLPGISGSDGAINFWNGRGLE